jgi:hypothetical protein
MKLSFLLLLLLVLPISLSFFKLKHKTKAECGENEIEGKLVTRSMDRVVTRPVVENEDCCLAVPINNANIFNLLKNEDANAKPQSSGQLVGGKLSFNVGGLNEESSNNIQLKEIYPVRYDEHSKNLWVKFSGSKDGKQFIWIFKAKKSASNLLLALKFNIDIILIHLLENPTNLSLIKFSSSLYNIIEDNDKDKTIIKKY